MAVDRADRLADVRRYVVAFAAQLALTAAAVAFSLLGGGGRAATAVVMLVAAVNAGVVAFRLMDVRRSGWYISMLVLLTIVLIAGLLVWPAWDVYDRARVF